MYVFYENVLFVNQYTEENDILILCLLDYTYTHVTVASPILRNFMSVITLYF